MYKIGKKKKIFLILFLVISLTNGCSWLIEPSTEATNESYEAGNKALNDGNYDEAISHYRQISRGSPFYPQAIWMIQKVPFKKGVASFKNKKYQIAIEEFLKVPVHSPDYEESQRYIKLTNYNLLLQKYLNSNSKNRFYMIKDLVQITNELDDSKLFLENIALIENELKIKTSKKKNKVFDKHVMEYS